MTPSTVTSMLLCQMCIHSSSKWFLSLGTVSRTGSDTRASLMS